MTKKIAIGLDIGGTNSVFGAVDEDGNILGTGQVSTCDYATPEEFVSALSSKFKKVIKAVKEEHELEGIGIGAPNGNYFRGTIENAPNLKWKGIIHLSDFFHQHFNKPVYLTNDANAAALGEMLYGGAHEMKDFIELTLGTGLGSGIVVNGDLVYGHNSFAGELGHTFVYMNEGRICGCGRRGCLETYVSAQGIKRTAIELIAEYNEASELRSIPADKLTSENIYQSALREDPIALKAFDVTGRYLGMKIADFVATTSPEAVFLYGGLAKAGDLIVRPTRKYLEQNLFGQFKNKVKVLLSELNEKNGALLGASALVWKKRKI
jgi:glucokinase